MKRTRVARVKGELRITRSDGSVELVSANRATEDARRYVRARDEELRSAKTLAIEGRYHEPIDLGIAPRVRKGIRADEAIELVREIQRERNRRKG